MSLEIDLYIFNLILPFSVNLVISQNITDSYIIGKIMSSSIGWFIYGSYLRVEGW